MSCKMVVEEPQRKEPAAPTETPTLSREAILGAFDAEIVAVDVPEWGGRVFIKNMSGRARDAFDQRVLGKNYDNIRAHLIRLCACDADGKLLFAPEDEAALGDKSAAVLERLWNVARQVNWVSSSDVDELKKD